MKRPLIHDEGRIKELPYNEIADIGVGMLPRVSTFDWDEEILLFKNGTPAALMGVMDLITMLNPDGVTFRVVDGNEYIYNDTDEVVL